MRVQKGEKWARHVFSYHHQNPMKARDIEVTSWKGEFEDFRLGIYSIIACGRKGTRIRLSNEDPSEGKHL